jgi:Mlc titration factor MtfA (ptsG expression regulator)
MQQWPMRFFSRYRTLRILRQHPIADADWFAVTRRIPLLAPLGANEKARLRELSTLFLHAKDFTGVQGLEITEEIRIAVAAQACLEILELGLDAYDGWVEIVIYPGAFQVQRTAADEFGIVHEQANALSGESWGRGPVIFSWEDVQRDSFTLRPGHNVVIHEFAHKLDMLNGRANGMPPLHPEMPIKDWTAALSEAYARLQQNLVDDRRPTIDPYAATDPAEFFAVVCEYFFTDPHTLRIHCAEVYDQLRAYFRQNPLAYYSSA